MAQQYEIGDLVGNWMVLGETIGKGWRKQILCKCACEKQTERYIHLNRLRDGRTLSCGCRPKVGSRQNQSRDKTFRVWKAMISRCTDEKHKSYKDYGGRGISVCSRWVDSYENFLNDMGEAVESVTLDRINVNGNYEPDNCRWATWKQQQNNRRNTIYANFQGRNRTLWEISQLTGINQRTLYSRYRDEVSFDYLYQPLEKVDIYFRGANRSLKEISEITGINIHTIRGRYQQGIPLDAPYESRKRTCVYFQGEIRTLSEISRITGINIKTLRGRLKNNIPLDKPLRNSITRLANLIEDF